MLCLLITSYKIMKGGHVRTGLPDWDLGQVGAVGVEGREQAYPAMVQHTV